MAWRGILAAATLAVNACASVGGLAPVSQAHGWRTYLGSARRAPAADTLATDPAALWRARVARGLVGAPALTEQLVVLAQVDQQLAVLDRATGKLLWRRRTDEYFGSGPLVDYDQVYAATQSGQGHVLAYELANGNRLWTATVGPTVAPLVVHDTRVFAANAAGDVTALSTSGGGRLWRTPLHGAVRAAPLLVGEDLAVATAADSLYLLNRDSGAVVARRATGGAVLAAPALADSVILFGTATGRLEACDTATLATRWSVDVGSGILGAVAVRADTAYVLTDDGDLWRVPLAAPTGASKIALGLVSRAAPTPVADGVLLTDVNGRVILVGPGGAERWSAQLPTPVDQPVLVDGRFMLAVSKRGEVVAFR